MASAAMVWGGCRRELRAIVEPPIDPARINVVPATGRRSAVGSGVYGPHGSSGGAGSGRAMALDLAQLVDPAVTAVVTSEVQNGVVGTSSALPALADEARREMLPSLERLLPGAQIGRAHV